MPAAGTTKIPKKVKAKILAEKRVKTRTADAIAKDYNISRSTVFATCQTKDPEVLALADSFERRIIAQAKTNVEKGLIVIEKEIIDNPKAPAQARINGMKESHALYRLETNQPTTINQINQAPIDRALKYARILLDKYGQEDGKQIYRLSNTAKIGIGASDEEWQEAEAQVFE